MLFDDSHPGIFTFLVGLIILVMVGVGLSMLVDSRFSFASSACALERDIQTGATALDQLRARQQKSAQHLADLEPRLQRAASAYEATRNQLARLRQRQLALVGSRTKLQESIQSMGQEFASYQAKCLERIWAAAAGQRLGTLSSRAGHEYREVVIMRVTAMGLEIRHAEGTARVRPQDLDTALRERFQWNAAEASTLLHRKLAPQDPLLQMK